MVMNAGIVQNSPFVLKTKTEEAPGVLTLTFFPAGKKNVFPFRPGQFVMVRFPNPVASGPRGRAYTVTSIPGESGLSITVKRMGPFSNTLCDLAGGDRVTLSGPYGSFFPHEEMRDMVFLAGGIGIAPFYTVIRNLAREGEHGKRVTLFYSNRTKSDIAFFDAFAELSGRLTWLKIVHTTTREKSEHPLIAESRRIDIRMLKKHLGKLNGRHYFICGPTSLVDDLKKKLKSAGVEENRIKTEAFY